MSQRDGVRVSRHAGRLLGLLAVGALLALPIACDGSGSGGGSGRLTIKTMTWGRLVDVTDAQDVLVHPDYVIGQNVVSDGQKYLLTRNPVTEVETLQILFDEGTPEFDSAFAQLDDTRGTVIPKGIVAQLPYSMVPRNAAIRIEFNTDVDESTLDSTTLKVSLGTPPSLPFTVRYLVDSVDPHVVIVDPTVTQIDSALSGDPINAIGYPPSVNQRDPNMTIEIPTIEDPVNGQIKILRSKSGSPVSSTNNGPVDPSDRSVVVRAYRTGNDSDLNRGFLLDLQAPRMLGQQSIIITNQSGNRLAYEFDTSDCAVKPDLGDVIQQGTLYGQVVLVIDDTPPDFVVDVRRLDDSGNPFSMIQRATYVSPYDDGPDMPECFIRFTPFASNPPAGGVDPAAMVTLRFSEPMDPQTIAPFDSFILSRGADPATITLSQFVVGEVVPSADNRSYSFVPSPPGIDHAAGVADDYYVHIITDQFNINSIRDLAGNTLDFPDLTIPFQIDSTAPEVKVGGLVLRLNQQDEDGNAQPEWRLQGTVNGDGTVDARSVTRFSVVIDPVEPVIGFMTVVNVPPPQILQTLGITVPVRTPLVPLGSRMMTVWRYIDMGFTYINENEYNLDVEGLAWAVFGNRVVADTFSRFEIFLAHSRFLPDEDFDPMTLLPIYPDSGLSFTSFASNVLDPANHAQQLVATGTYAINPLDAFVATSGSGQVMVPFPDFQNEFGEKVTFTWRDTIVEARGAPNGNGVDPTILNQVYGPGAAVAYEPRDEVPSIGLPLLMDFRCYPDQNADGLNAFQLSMTSTASVRPTFRIHSTGGYNSANQPVTIDPTSDRPLGGYNPGSNPPGQRTRPDDNLVYWGQIDFVIRVSRGVTRWFDTGVVDPSPIKRFPAYQTPVIEPLPSQQPIGSRVIVEYRAADAVSVISTQATNADCVDLYGKQFQPAIKQECGPPQTPTGLADWTDQISDLDGKRWVQIRWSMLANIATGAAPTLSTIGVGWLEF